MRLNFVFLFITTLLICSYAGVLWVSAGEDSDAPVTDTAIPDDSEWVYARIEYEHDLLAPNLYFLELLAHPGGKVPMIDGGYASTDVHAVVRLRGVDVPRAMHDPSERHRPHIWRERERRNWAAAMRYVWNVCEPTKTFRVHHIEVIEKDNVLEADIEFWLGGAWQNLAIALMNDEHARPLQKDGSTWDPGSKAYSLENPNVPR